jgi:uncharacterized protein YndB with AHSA1/START domain
MANPAYAPETKLEVRRMFAAPRERVFEAWTPPKKLVSTWDWEKFSASGEKVDQARDTLVSVEFEPRGIFTEVILTHEGLATAGQREAHSKGWNGCFDRHEEELKA